MNKNICMCTYSNTVPESPSPLTFEVETTATSSDSESDQSTDSLPPSPKQPRIERKPEVSVVNIDVAYLSKRRSSLTEHEKYSFYCYHFTPDIDLQVSMWRWSWLSTLVFDKVQLVYLQLARESWILSSLCALCLEHNVQKGACWDSIY